MTLKIIPILRIIEIRFLQKNINFKSCRAEQFCLGIFFVFSTAILEPFDKVLNWLLYNEDVFYGSCTQSSNISKP